MNYDLTAFADKENRLTRVSTFMTNDLSEKTHNQPALIQDLLKSVTKILANDGLEILHKRHDKIDQKCASVACLAFFCQAVYVNPSQHKVKSSGFIRIKRQKASVYEWAIELGEKLESFADAMIELNDLRLLEIGFEYLNRTTRATDIIRSSPDARNLRNGENTRQSLPGYLEVVLSDLPTADTLVRRPIIEDRDDLFRQIDEISGCLDLSYNQFVEILGTRFSAHDAEDMFFHCYCQTIVDHAALPSKDRAHEIWSEMKSDILALREGNNPPEYKLSDESKLRSSARWGRLIAECDLGFSDIRSVPEYGELLSAAYKKNLPTWPITSNDDRDFVIEYVTSEHFTDKLDMEWLSARM